MALGSVSVPGVSKKAKERMMYMDGKLIWSAAMGESGSSSVTAPDGVDYIIVKQRRRPTRTSGSHEAARAPRLSDKLTPLTVLALWMPTQR